MIAPGALLETVTVTATRTEQRLGDVPASVSVLTSEEIKASPALVADDVLRQIPTFSLFRRASSLVAQPTTQGVSLRGIGPSGQSRTLVLLDGIPFNDPFGGWVYWTRVPLISVDRVEVAEDPTSSLYGNSAMGGVINIITSRPTPRTLELNPQYGSRKSPKLDFFASDRWKKVGVAVEGSFFNSDGYPIVAPMERGPIDINANVDYRNVSAKVDYAPTDRINTFFRTGYFTENRINGKVGEGNDTKWTTVSGGVQMRLPDDSELQARVFGDLQRAHFNFLAVTNSTTTRNIVRLATDQHVPTDGVGDIVQWTKAVRSHAFSAGTDWRWVDGDSQEDAFVAGTLPVPRQSLRRRRYRSSACLEERSRSWVRSCRTCSRRCRRWWSRSAPAPITGGTTTVITWKPRSRPACPPSTTSRPWSTGTTPWSARAPRCSTISRIGSPAGARSVRGSARRRSPSCIVSSRSAR